MNSRISLFIVAFLVIVLSAVSVVVILNYNGLVKAEKVIQSSQAQIETVCQRRLDLIPNLVEIVKKYAQHEKETLMMVTQARTKAMDSLKNIGADKTLTKEEMLQLEASQSGVSNVFRSILALAENYPDLKASSSFLALQDQFEGTENRISVARQRYNVAVGYYNAKIETFPGVFLAPMFGFGEKVFFESQSKALEGIKVDL